MPQTIKAKDLLLADTVKIGPHGSFGGAWETAIVTKVTDTEVHLFRPYGTTADFSYTGGVIPYIGVETFSIPRNENEYLVHCRKNLR